MSSVLARFSLVEVTRVRVYVPNTENKNWGPAEGVRVKLAPVQGEPFGSATPSGFIEMTIANMASAQVFIDAPIDQMFDVLMTPVES